MRQRLCLEVGVIVGYLTVVSGSLALVHLLQSESNTESWIQVGLNDAILPALLLSIGRTLPRSGTARICGPKQRTSWGILTH